MLIVSLEQLEWLGLIVGSSSVSGTVPLGKDGSLGRTWGVLAPFLWFEVADVKVDTDGV